jgi:hypothetical protein
VPRVTLTTWYEEGKGEKGEQGRKGRKERGERKGERKERGKREEKKERTVERRVGEVEVEVERVKGSELMEGKAGTLKKQNGDVLFFFYYYYFCFIRHLTSP